MSEFEVSGVKYKVRDLVTSRLALDLTSDRWMLPEGTASMIRGKNVVRPGILGPDPGRRPAVTNFLPANLSIDGPITAAHGMNLEVSAPGRIQDYIAYNATAALSLYIFVDNNNNQATTTKTGLRINQVGGVALGDHAISEWPEEVVGGVILFNDDSDNLANVTSRAVQPLARRITSRGSFQTPNDTIFWAESINPSDLSWPLENSANFNLGSIYAVHHQNFTVIYRKEADRRGILATNGKSWYFIQNGNYFNTGALPFPTTDQGLTGLPLATYLGEEWDAAPIAPHLMLFVNPRYQARVWSFSDRRWSRDLNEVIPTLREITPAGLRPPAPDNAYLDAQEIRVSSNDAHWYCQVTGTGTLPSGAMTGGGIASVNGGTVRVKLRLVNLDENVYSRFVDVFDAFSFTRDVNIPAGTSGGAIYISPNAVAWPGSGTNPPVRLDKRATHLEVWRTPVNIPDFYLERRIVLRNGMDHPHTSATEYTLGGFARVACYLSDVALLNQPLLDPIEVSFGYAPPCCQKVEYFDGLCVCGGKADPEAPLDYAVHSIATRIKDDEEIWYSRVLGPEVFAKRTLRVSTGGDTFRNLVKVGTLCAVIMDDGVHLLRRVGDDLVRETVSEGGDGTPWPESVIAWEQNVVWGTRYGPNTMTVSTEPDASGKRGRIQSTKNNGLRQWFKDAFDSDHEVKAGLDGNNSCIRFRKKITDDIYETLQWNYSTDEWTILDNDPGDFYVSSAYASTTPLNGQVLNTVWKTGAIHEVNYEGLTHPHDAYTIQDILSADKYQVPSVGTSIVTVASSGALFSVGMTGEVIRFRSANPAVDGQVRVITLAAAIGGASIIDFAQVAGLAFGDEFLIGANLFRVRFSAEKGEYPHTVKTLSGLNIRALPGPRSRGTNSAWPYPPAGKLTTRVYEDYSPAATREALQEIPIFDSGNVQYQSVDRVSAIEGQGTSLEVEVECMETRSDFRLESISVRTREELDVYADTDAAT